MTDLTSVDLSHLSDEEFNALCPQGEHAPGAKPLSPAAQAVLDAFGTYPLRADHISEDLIPALAAALRSAADQVVPEPSNAAKALFSLATVQILYVIRDDFHAIAAELEGQ